MLKLSRDRPMSFLLESVEGGAVRGRYSMIGLEPDIIWRAFGNRAPAIVDPQRTRTTCCRGDDRFEGGSDESIAMALAVGPALEGVNAEVRAMLDPTRVRRYVAHPPDPDLWCDLPWSEPLEEWQSERIVRMARGVSRHVVRFVATGAGLPQFLGVLRVDAVLRSPVDDAAKVRPP